MKVLGYELEMKIDLLKILIIIFGIAVLVVFWMYYSKLEVCNEFCYETYPCTKPETPIWKKGVQTGNINITDIPVAIT